MPSRDIIVVATSTGGLEALKQLLAPLPADLPASVFIVMHIGAHSSLLPAILRKSCALPVKHATNGNDFFDSTVYIAPPDRHLLLYNGKMLLSDGPKENFTRPAADPLFRSAAVMYGQRVIGVVLTGNLDDGAAGLKAVRACGGYALVQEPSDCRSPSMPLAALQSAGADRIAPIHQLATAILDALEPTMDQTRPQDPEEIKAVAAEEQMVRTGEVELAQLDSIGKRSSLTCPDCGGVIWRIGTGLPLRYRCHTGHAFSAGSLEDQQRKQSENAIWNVIRVIEERLFLARDLLDQSTQAGHDVTGLHERIAALEEARIAARSVLPGSGGTPGD